MDNNVKRYFEIELIQKERINDDVPDTFWMCIVAEREPSFEEAEVFLKEDMKNLGYDTVSDIIEINYDEAHEHYDMEDEDNFPVFK